MIDYSKLKVGSSPHVRTSDSTRQIMLDVVIALMPALAISFFVFGGRALSMVAVSVIGCIFFEWLYQVLLKKPVTISDFSCVVTGILIAYCMPVSAPMWLVLIGDAFAIIIVKQLFGGIGKNFMNPALGARAFLTVSWPVLMTTWTRAREALPLFVGVTDAVTSATPLAELTARGSFVIPAIDLRDLLIGMHGGSLGETSALALLAGALYLLYRRVITWHIPVCYLGTVAVLTFFFPGGNDPVRFMVTHLLSGGLMLGAIFMATDYSSSPITKRGKIIYGIGCGLLTVFIRYFGSYPEGVSFAILLMNACVFLIEKISVPRVFGHQKKLKLKKAPGGDPK